MYYIALAHECVAGPEEWADAAGAQQAFRHRRAVAEALQKHRVGATTRAGRLAGRHEDAGAKAAVLHCHELRLVQMRINARLNDSSVRVPRPPKGVRKMTA